MLRPEKGRGGGSLFIGTKNKRPFLLLRRGTSLLHSMPLPGSQGKPLAPRGLSTSSYTLIRRSTPLPRPLARVRHLSWWATSSSLARRLHSVVHRNRRRQ